MGRPLGTEERAGRDRRDGGTAKQGDDERKRKSLGELLAGAGALILITLGGAIVGGLFGFYLLARAGGYTSKNFGFWLGLCALGGALTALKLALTPYRWRD